MFVCVDASRCDGRRIPLFFVFFSLVFLFLLTMQRRENGADVNPWRPQASRRRYQQPSQVEVVLMPTCTDFGKRRVTNKRRLWDMLVVNQ